MKVNYYREETLRENRVDVYYRKKDREIEDLMTYLQADQALYGKNEREQRRLYLGEIYYVEVVERRCFAYMKEEVFEVESSLKGFLEHYQGAGFLQIGKAAAVNVRRIERIVPDINMRMHLIMENGEQLVVNRAYKKEFIAYLKQKKEEGTA